MQAQVLLFVVNTPNSKCPASPIPTIWQGPKN